MQSGMFYCLFALAVGVASARRITFNDTNMPITLVETSYGQGDHERVTYLRADIRPRHQTIRQRINFPKSGYLNDYYQRSGVLGDERGHLVSSRFSGPAEWYNLSPQIFRVNRNSGYQSISPEWYEAECKVQIFLQQNGSRHVIWKVHMTYVCDSNRPDQYHLQVDFIENGRVVNSIDIWISNPSLTEDRTYWFCRACSRDRHNDYEEFCSPYND